MKIFLSHRSRDKALIREFREMLPSFLAAWLDEDTLCWGDSLERQLKSAIQSDVDFLIIFLDVGALESSWVRKELDWALERESKLGRTFVLPILLENVTAEMLPAGFLDRIHLRLADYTHASVESLAKQASLGLFQLVAKSYSSLQDLGSDRRPPPPRVSSPAIVVNPDLVKVLLDKQLPKDWCSRSMYVGRSGALNWLEVASDPLCVPDQKFHDHYVMVVRLLEHVPVQTFVSLGPGDARLDEALSTPRPVATIYPS